MPGIQDQRVQNAAETDFAVRKSGCVLQEDIVAAMSENCALEEASPILADCSDVPADDTTCAICLNQIAASETAQPACCEHIYCSEIYLQRMNC